MNEIKCPECGKTFQVAASDWNDIVAQVRASEIESAVAVERARIEAEAELARAEDRQRIVELESENARIADVARETESAWQQKAASERQAGAAEAREAASERISELQRDLDASKAEIEAQKRIQAAEKDSAVAAVREEVAKERQTLKGEIADLKHDVERARENGRSMLDALKAEMASQEKVFAAERDAAIAEAVREAEAKAADKDAVIREKDAQIELLREHAAKRTVKLIGESLEQHCADEFAAMQQMGAFPGVVFEKDNTVVEGTKGDFILRKSDGDIELASIMFEMKSEAAGSTNKKRNEDHFRKLDSDRKKKNCEFAVLVSELEVESELYNRGIVVVNGYEKMFVVRPQFFIPVTSLILNMAESTAVVRRELHAQQQEDFDAADWNEKLTAFRGAFGAKIEQMNKRRGEAIEAIDAAIKNLQKVKEKLLAEEKQQDLAEKKLDGFTVAKLVKKNPTKKQQFLDAGVDIE